MQVLPGFGHGGSGRRAGLGVGREGTGCTVVGTDSVAVRRGGRRGRGQVSPSLGLTRLGQAAG